MKHVSKTALLAGAGFGFGFLVIFHVIHKAYGKIDFWGLDIIQFIVILLTFSGIAAASWLNQQREEENPLRHLSILIAGGFVILVLSGLLSSSSVGSFYLEDGKWIPTTYSSLFISIMFAFLAGTAAVITCVRIGLLIYIKRNRKTQRNVIFFISTLAANIAVAGIAGSPSEDVFFILAPFSHLLFTLMIVAIIIISLRMPWIAYLTKQEKLQALLLSFFGSIFFILNTIFSMESTNQLSQSLAYIHPALRIFVSISFLLAAIYLTVCFASTLFHLPTAEAFDRKKAELSTMHNLSKLVKSVFNEDELLTTAVRLSREICDADGAWIEINSRVTRTGNTENAASGKTPPRAAMWTAVSDSMSKDDMRVIVSTLSETCSTAFSAQNKPIVIQNAAHDKKISLLRGAKLPVGSVAAFPLQTHDKLIGRLYAFKKMNYGFDRDNLNSLSAFADQIAIAIENHWLITALMEGERLEQELLVARQMQQRLLPATLPSSPVFDMAAKSIPAHEVGGDYYDVVRIDSDTIGITVGDVSGKSVSAALYMAETKGIFQSLTKFLSDPRQVLQRMNEALYGTIERNSFVSLLYAILDTRRGVVQFARAGHCPLLWIHGRDWQFLRPDGLGLGLDGGEIFEKTLAVETIQLQTGDVLIMYTDGVSEARNGDGEEFGYQRLAEAVLDMKRDSAEFLLDGILERIHDFTRTDVIEDDLTLLILIWKGA